LTETHFSEPRGEPVGPLLHLGAIGAARSTWLGPGWAALCGLIASGAFSFDGAHVLIAAFVFILADWAWPALWTTAVRTDWRAPAARWPDFAVSSPERSIRLPYFQPGSPGARLLNSLTRARIWWHDTLAPSAGASVTSGIAALIVGLALSAAIGWRALALTLGVAALTGLGILRALRVGVDSDGLRSIVYGTMPWWLGHVAFASLTAESVGLAVLFGLAYWAWMGLGEHAPSPSSLAAPQAIAALALFAGQQAVAAFVVFLAVAAQVALRAFLVDRDFARRGQGWLMLAMLACALVAA
jgi:hypothetical protein